MGRNGRCSSRIYRPRKHSVIVCGAFSDKWVDVAKRCGKEADAYDVEWDKTLTPELDGRLSSGDYDLVALVHNETSCGMMNPLEDIVKVLTKYPEVLSVVDTLVLSVVSPFRKTN